MSQLELEQYKETADLYFIQYNATSTEPACCGIYVGNIHSTAVKNNTKC